MVSEITGLLYLNGWPSAELIIETSSEPAVMILRGLSHQHGSGPGFILDFQELCAFWQTSLRSYQFTQNESGRTLFR